MPGAPGPDLVIYNSQRVFHELGMAEGHRSEDIPPTTLRLPEISCIALRVIASISLRPWMTIRPEVVAAPIAQGQARARSGLRALIDPLAGADVLDPFCGLRFRFMPSIACRSNTTHPRWNWTSALFNCGRGRPLGKIVLPAV